MEVYGKTDPGMVRDTNQDTFAYGNPINNGYFALVCDGMGGSNGGNVASQMARDQITECFIRQMHTNMNQNEIYEMIQCAFEQANTTVLQKAASDSSLRGMGTTAVAAVIINSILYIGHVGDSRAYLYADGVLSQLTQDHSFVQMLVEQGKITKEQVQNHPRRNEITRAIGAVPEIRVDFTTEDFRQGNWLLLCSDGLTSACTDAQILNILKCSTVEKSIDRLIDLANEQGGRDNITIVAASSAC